MADRRLLEEERAHSDGEKDAKSEPEGDERYNARPVVVDDAFKHNI